MGNGLDTKDTFALGIDLQGQLAAMELEHRQIVRGSLERDFPFGRRFVPRAIFRTTFVSEDCLDRPQVQRGTAAVDECLKHLLQVDRKSTRLNSSHQIISYAVFCLKKKNKHEQ